MRPVTVQELIDELSELNPDSPVVLSSYDHSYSDISGSQEVEAEVIRDGDRDYNESYDGESCSGGKVIKAVLIY